jgi:hypothetical protein
VAKFLKIRGLVSLDEDEEDDDEVALSSFLFSSSQTAGQNKLERFGLTIFFGDDKTLAITTLY